NLLNVSEGWLKIGGIFEMLIISYAVAIRMKTLSNDNDKMREEIEQFTLQIGTLTINQKEEQKISLPENELTLRELEIFKLLITGKSNSEIAKDVFLSVNTIKYHTKNIYEKLNIKNKLEAIAKFKN
ncbi:MAG: LuxR C-terminal-related transcriptional regulator, partial [Ferruginibacter sp.]